MYKGPFPYGLLNSFYYAFRGISTVIKTQRNMKIHLFFASLTILTSYLFQISRIEWMFIWICIFSVLVTEAINTAIEKNIDIYTQKTFNEDAMLGKDIAAGAVLLSVFNAIVVSILIFFPKITGTT